MNVTSALLTVVFIVLICAGVDRSGAFAQGALPSQIIATNSCKDAAGIPVALKYVVGAENAVSQNGTPVILLDANVLNHEPIQVAEFLYFSECGHHVLGHVYNATGGEPPGPADGFDADCWALRFLQHASGYGPSDTAIILAGLTALNVPGYPYPQGAQRAYALRACR